MAGFIPIYGSRVKKIKSRTSKDKYTLFSIEFSKEKVSHILQASSPLDCDDWIQAISDYQSKSAMVIEDLKKIEKKVTK